jgi:hypothetical protein
VTGLVRYRFKDVVNELQSYKGGSCTLQWWVTILRHYQLRKNGRTFEIYLQDCDPAVPVRAS